MFVFIKTFLLEAKMTYISYTMVGNNSPMDLKVIKPHCGVSWVFLTVPLNSAGNLTYLMEVQFSLGLYRQRQALHAKAEANARKAILREISV